MDRTATGGAEGTRNMKTLALVLALGTAVPLAGATTAHAADPIVGTWRLDDGRTIRFAGSGSRFCGKAVGGKFAGRSIGCLSAQGNGRYRGKITDLSADKTYSGKASVSGNSLKLSGCVLGGLICRSSSATRR